MLQADGALFLLQGIEYVTYLQQARLCHYLYVDLRGLELTYVNSCNESSPS